ncbi:MAG: hypothetical protein QUU85_17650 [Candidatus Eisenbacteria bacterium]|nr:hypothetical protein [Candidatus Eisenbacteria bacterium]
MPEPTRRNPDTPDTAAFERAVTALKALGHPLRLRANALLHGQKNG